MLCPFVSLLACEQRHAARIESDELPPEVMIGDVPSWAFDVYSREGHAAFAHSLETDAPAARWVRAALGQPVVWRSSGISSSGSRAALSPIECGGRWPKSFAAKLTSSAQVQGAVAP